MLLLWGKTPPPSGLPLLFRQGSFQLGNAQLPALSGTFSIGENPDGWNISGTVQFSANGSLNILESRDAVVFNGSVTNTGALSITERRDTDVFNGVVTDRGSLSINEARDNVNITGSVFSASAAGSLSILERRDLVAFAGTSQQAGGATNYWGRVVEKRHLHPDAPDYTRAIAEAIRNEQIARQEKQRLEKELKAVKVPPRPTRKPPKEAAKAWIDPTKELRHRIAIQDALIKEARADELRLRLQAVNAERIAKQNQEQEDILLVLLAMDD